MRTLLALGLLLLAGTAHADFADEFALNTDIPGNKAPVVGHSRVLVLPLEVDDGAHPLIDMGQVEAFFGDGGVFPRYFALASGGSYSVDAVVANKVTYATCPLPAEFVGCAVPRGNTDALGPALDVLRDALNQTHDAGTNFTEFDVNGAGGASDGYIDGFVVLLNIDFGGIALPIGDLNHGSNLAGGTDGPFILDGVEIPYVSIGGTQQVLLHEFCHQLGLADLYDEDQLTGGLDLSLMGNWDYDNHPPLLDAESRYKLGWAHSVHLTQSASITLHPAEEDGGMLRVGGDREYFLLENRGPGPANNPSVDQDQPSRGIAIFHVDWSVGPSGMQGSFVDRLINCVNCDLYHPFVLNEVARDAGFRWLSANPSVADELFEAGDSLSPDGTAPFSATHAVASTDWYGGTTSGITFEIEAGQGNDFVVKVTQPTSTCTPVPACPAESICPSETCWELPATGASLHAKKGGCSSSPGSVELLALGAALTRLRRRRPR